MLGIGHKMGICGPFPPYPLVLTLPPTSTSLHILYWQNGVMCICQNILGRILLSVGSLYLFFTLFPCSFPSSPVLFLLCFHLAVSLSIWFFSAWCSTSNVKNLSSDSWEDKILDLFLFYKTFCTLKLSLMVSHRMWINVTLYFPLLRC